jgi:ribose-phosphate pyrophosphokinase
MLVLPGPSSLVLGHKIAEQLKSKAHPIEHRIFPDGESYIKITPNVKNEKVVIVQTTAPDPDRKLIQLLMMAKTAMDFGSKKVITVVPYLAYSRQDKRFLEGEALALDIVIALLEKVGVSDLIVVDIHNEESIREIESNYKVSVHNLSAIPILAKYLKENGFKRAYSLAPDKGSIHLAEKSNSVLLGGYSYFEKFRDRKTGEIEMQAKDLDVLGRNAIVFDDIISSGGTMAKAVKRLKEQGAVRVATACSHALFMNGAEEKLRNAGADLILAADTVENPYNKISIARLVAEHLKAL